MALQPCDNEMQLLKAANNSLMLPSGR